MKINLFHRTKPELPKKIAETFYYTKGTSRAVYSGAGQNYVEYLPGYQTQLKAMGVDKIRKYYSDNTFRQLDRVELSGRITEQIYNFEGKFAVKEYQKMLHKAWEAKKAGFLVSL